MKIMFNTITQMESTQLTNATSGGITSSSSSSTSSSASTATKKRGKSSSSTSASGGKSYKHIPHREKPPHLVARRNARERRRVQAVNSAFATLRKCVPIENRSKRLSKVKTLQKAIEYIYSLKSILGGNPEGDEEDLNDYHVVRDDDDVSNDDDDDMSIQQQQDEVATEDEGIESSSSSPPFDSRPSTSSSSSISILSSSPSIASCNSLSLSSPVFNSSTTSNFLPTPPHHFNNPLGNLHHQHMNHQHQNQMYPHEHPHPLNPPPHNIHHRMHHEHHSPQHGTSSETSSVTPSHHHMMNSNTHIIPHHQYPIETCINGSSSYSMVYTDLDWIS